MKSIVIIGQGQLGLALTQRHLFAQDQVTSVSRSDLSPLSSHHQHIITDLDQINTAIRLPQIIDCLYYLAPPSNTDLHDQRLQAFLRLHNMLVIRHIIYISTSGVYGDSRGQWVNENTPAKPVADRAKRRLDAENQLIQHQQHTETAVTILRCAAIYSKKTVNIEKIVANKKPVIKQNQAPFTNRIHLDDLTEVCWQAMLHPPESIETYNVSDGCPSTTTEHARLLAELAGAPQNPEINLKDAGNYYSSAYLSYLNESKKLDITKLKQHLNPVFKFDNCRKGIMQCLQQTEKN